MLSAASYTARCLALYSLYNGLSSWVLSLHSKLPGLHRGVENSNVVHQVGRIIGGRSPNRPFELLVDGDLYTLVWEIVQVRGPGTTAVSKVKGHAAEGMVLQSRVRELHRIGNDLADQASIFGRGSHRCQGGPNTCL